jgi:diaminohydroxyphosphoribosylaminopyrimidine deaminase/5-amino-6-(5-phosphoribosylamino)uracil reductase
MLKIVIFVETAYFCFMEIDEVYMKRCIELAQKGVGSARPNPSVGCVLVVEDRIIGEGFTSSYGGNHAEVNAIQSVEDKKTLEKATLYVTLEPCAHFGKTPPCADLIVTYKIPKVVIGCVDTYSKVSGKGIEHLLNSGCEVKVGVLEKACLFQHRRFFTVQNKKRPYIILKWAETQDGYIAPEKKETNRPVWISNSYAQQLVHKWRSEEHAILVGTNTAIVDSPILNVRKWNGNSPVRIVLDRSLRISSNNPLFDGSIETIVCTDISNIEKTASKENLLFEGMDFDKNVAEQICEILLKQNIQSVIIEGGRQTLQTFIDADLWDEARVFSGVVFFESGVKAPFLPVKAVSEKKIKDTNILFFTNPSQQF